MKTILLAGALVVFAGIAATVSAASDHKPAKHAPATASVMTSAAPSGGHHKGSAPRRHHAPKKHHAAHKAHAK